MIIGQVSVKLWPNHIALPSGHVVGTCPLMHATRVTHAGGLFFEICISKMNLSLVSISLASTISGEALL